MTDFAFITTQPYGTCGFRSAHALHHAIQPPVSGGPRFYSNYSDSQFRLSFWNNILSFISSVSCPIGVRDGMIKFTHAMPGFEKFSFEGWKAHITKYLGEHGAHAGDLTHIPDTKFNAPPTGNKFDYSIATTPKAIEAFLRYMGHQPADLALNGLTAPSEHCIVGWTFAEDKGKWTMHDCLGHWTYVDDNGTVYSWGDQYTYGDYASGQKATPIVAFQVV